MKPPASAYRNNPKNDRSKRDYLIYLKDARQRSPATGYRRRQPERALQSHVAWFLAIALPADAICLASAGGDRQRTQSPGYIAGTPDLAILHRGRAFFVELKAGKASRVAKAQAKCHLALLACGCPVAICRSLADVAEACETWSIPLRAGLTA